jgi:hypothetical protein
MMRAWLTALLVGLLACSGTPSREDSDVDVVADARPVDEPDATPLPLDDGGAPSFKVVFATSSKHNGDLGGRGAPDAQCGERAAAAGLEGTFLAWMSTPEVAAGERLAHADVPYVRTDWERVADDWDDLVDGTLLAPIDRDEDAAPVLGDAWTGTRADGQPATLTCGGFDTTGDVGVCGSTGETGAAWTDSIQPPCTSALRLYCVQQ